MQPLLLDQEFQVLGQQKLTELRDKIICMADHIAVGEFSENPNQQPDILTKVNITGCHSGVVVVTWSSCSQQFSSADPVPQALHVITSVTWLYSVVLVCPYRQKLGGH